MCIDVRLKLPPDIIGTVRPNPESLSWTLPPVLSALLFVSWVVSWVVTGVPYTWNLALLLFFYADLPPWLLAISLAWLAPGVWLAYAHRRLRSNPGPVQMHPQLVEARNVYAFAVLAWVLSQLAWFGFAWNFISFPGGSLLFLGFPAVALYLLFPRTDRIRASARMSLALSMGGTVLLGSQETLAYTNRDISSGWIFGLGTLVGAIGLFFGSIFLLVNFGRQPSSEA